MIVVDTHIFIWYALDDSHLDRYVREAIRAEPRGVFVPSICIWEAMMLVERGRLDLGGGDPGAMLKQLISESGFQEAPLSNSIAILSRTLQFEHNDPADRFVASTAHAMNAFLATEDRHLRSLPWVKLLH